jgi:DedD protein
LTIIRAVDGSIMERLTGALIFVAAVVIIVPEMFSGPGNRGRAQQVPAEPADVAAPMRTYSMPVDGAAVEALTVPVSEPAEIEPAMPPAAAPQLAPPPTAAAAELLPAAPKDSVAAPAVAVASTPAVPAPAPPRPAPGGNWWTQVGIFSSRDNAERLSKQLRTGGFDVQISKYVSGGKDMFRVRAGPVEDRAAAAALQARLKAAGHAALLVAP